MESPSYLKNLRLRENISREELNALKLKVRLSNGCLGDVVSCYKKHNKWGYICHVCNVSGIDWKSFFAHISGNRHKDSLKKPVHEADKFLIKDDKGHAGRGQTDRIKPLMETEVRLSQKDANDRQTRKSRNDQARNSSFKGSKDNRSRDRRRSPYDRNRRQVSPPRIQPFVDSMPQRPPVSNIRLDEEERRFYEYIRSSKDVSIWQYYNERVQIFEENLLVELKFYKENPERHPKYLEEQIKYWQERNQELIAMGEDPRNYDIKVEWNAYWDIRLHELFREVFESNKVQLQNLLQSIQGNYDKGNARPATEKPSREESMKKSADISVIPVLRKLSVLEHNLGSLGPKVVELLSKALTLEKFSKNGANAIMESEDNCILLETAKEKLKGLMQSGLLPEALHDVTQNSVMNISELLECSANLRKRARSRSLDYDINARDKRSKDEGLKTRKSRSRSKNRGFASRDKRSRSRSRGNSFKGMSSARDTRLPSTRGRSRSRNRELPSRSNRSHSRNRGLDTRQRRSRSKDRRNFHDNGFDSRDRRLSNDEKLFHNNASYKEMKLFDNRDQMFQQGNYPAVSNNPQMVIKNLKVSEIGIYIDKLEILSHLSFMQKTGMAQQIASLLLIRGVLEITETELLLLIKTILMKDNSGPLTSGNIPYSAMNAILPSGPSSSINHSSNDPYNQNERSNYPGPLISYPIGRNHGRY